jgi:hypothetical protein
MKTAFGILGSSSESANTARSSRRSRAAGLLAVLLGAALISGCRDKTPENLAPAASALSSAAPVDQQGQAFKIETASSKVSFSMDAPIEKISGEAPASVEGQLFVNPSDLGKSSGLLKIDLEKLELYQQKREDEKGDFGERKKNDLQNQHARTWLEIADDAPPDVRAKNRYVEFLITRIENASVTDLGKLSGPERKLTATVVGELRLHGRKSDKRANVELTFSFAGEKPTGLSVRTLTPVAVSLEEYDVRPREAFGKLAQKTLDALGSKVAKSAPIQLEFKATAQ